MININSLPEEMLALFTRIPHYQSKLRGSALTLLLKLWNNEPLSEIEDATEVTPTEVAAIWSVVNRTDISPDYVRETRRHERITPAQEWGEGSGYRCTYLVKDVKDIQVGHQRGRPRRKKMEP